MCAWQLEGSPWKCQPPWALKNIIGLRSCEHFELWSYCGVSLWFRFLISFSLLEHPRHLPTLDFDWYPKIHSHFSFKSFHLERSGPPEIHVGINIPPNSFGVQSNFFEGVSLLIGLHGSANGSNGFYVIPIVYWFGIPNHFSPMTWSLGSVWLG